MSTLETMKIADGNGGYIVINKEDFNAETDTLYQEQPAAAPEGKADKGDDGKGNPETKGATATPPSDPNKKK